MANEPIENDDLPVSPDGNGPDAGDDDNPASDTSPKIEEHLIWPKIRQILQDHKGQGLTLRALARRLELDSVGMIELRRVIKKLIK
ncbi:MAG: hypothetical protein ACKO5E_19240, partial [bacterium]